MDSFEKIDERIDTKLGQVMDRLSALENISNSTRSGSSSESGAGNLGGGGGGGSTAPAVFAPSHLDRSTHSLTEAQAKELVAKLRQGIGPDLDCMIARVGAMSVRNAKVSKWCLKAQFHL